MFVSNVLNGTIERLVLGLNQGAVWLLSSTLISSGYTHRGDPAALEVGPPVWRTTPFAIQVSQNGLKGFRIYNDTLHLHGALALTIATERQPHLQQQ